jgi:hypothetical protein
MYLKLQRKVAKFIGILLLSLTVAVPAVATAETRAQKSIITQLLWQSLLRCYVSPVERLTLDDEVVLRVELNTTGDIANLPDIMSPVIMSKGERGLLREATKAIIDCTPIVSAGGGKSIYGRFDMVLSRAGMTLTNVDAYVGNVDVIPSLDSLDVTSTDSVLQEITPPDESETASPEVSLVEVITPSEPVEAAADPAVTLTEPATKASESVLELTRTERREIQRRLDLLDYNTRGIDGVFWPGSRTAIRQWQTDVGVPSSSYFDLNQIALLREMSQDLYTTWNARPKRYTDRFGCLREPNGTIIQGRTFKCDLNAASQSMGLSK